MDMGTRAGSPESLLKELGVGHERRAPARERPFEIEGERIDSVDHAAWPAT